MDIESIKATKEYKKNSSLPVLKVKFLDFWFHPNDENFIYSEEFMWFVVLQKYYKLEINFVGEPDLVIFGVFGKRHVFQYRHIPRIFHKSEAHRDVKKEHYDYMFGWCADGANQSYVMTDVIHRPNLEMLLNNTFDDRFTALRNKTKTKFCNFVNSNDMLSSHVREAFTKQLMNYKLVDCPGKILNNMPSIDKIVADAWDNKKIIFQGDYKFSIAFENQSQEGYISEKIFHPWYVKSIPIYWGDPTIGEKFNTKAFVNCHDYDSFEEVIAHIIEIDNNDDLYQSYLNESPFLENNFPPLGLDIDAFEQKVLEVINRLTSSDFIPCQRPKVSINDLYHIGVRFLRKTKQLINRAIKK